MKYPSKPAYTWAEDIHAMHQKFGVHKWMARKIDEEDYSTLREFLDFRIKFLEEELNETKAAVVLDKNAQEVVDGLIDLCVVAIGTLDILGVDANKAWSRVHKANMSKEPGKKPSRPNPLGLPDMIKPEGWVGPNHADNVGDTHIILHHSNDGGYENYE